MTNEELVMQIKAGVDVNENMLQLWKQMERFVYRIALRYKAHAELDDLIQEGYLGLCEAVKYYDPEEASFIHYASFWIKQVMLRYISNFSNGIRVPEHARNEVYRYKKIKADYIKTYGKEPSNDEMMHVLGVSHEKYETIKKNALSMQINSMNAPLATDDELVLEDVIASEEEFEEDVMRKIDCENMRIALWKAIDKLPGDMPVVMACRYKDGLTLKESGEKLGVTTEAVRQKEAKAFRQLRLKRVSKDFKPYYDQYLAMPIRHVGVREFNRVWTSSTELAAMWLYERQSVNS